MKRMLRRIAVGLLLAVLLACAAQAEMYQQVEGFGQMEKLAQVAVLCQVDSQPQRQEYVMHTCLQVERVFKGKVENQILLRQSTGEQPLAAGQYVLFLEQREDNQGVYYYLCCGLQGVFRLEEGQLIAQDQAMDDAELQAWAQVYLPQEPPATAVQRAAWLAGLLTPVFLVMLVCYLRQHRGSPSPLKKR